MTLYHMPIYKQLAELIRSGALGPLRFIQMNFGSYKEYDMNNRFFNRSWPVVPSSISASMRCPSSAIS